MKQNIKEILAEAKSVSMNDRERAELQYHMEMLFARKGIPWERRDPYRKRYINSPYYLGARAWTRWFMKQSYASSVVFFLVLFLSTGVAGAAAAGALPGDFLYSVKVNVNETLRRVFTYGTEARANLHAQLVKQRLTEAEALEAKGRLTDEARAYLAENLRFHQGRFENELGTTNLNAGIAELRNEFDALLIAHQAILEKLEAVAAGTSTESR